jgi:hypothetical protein
MASNPEARAAINRIAEVRRSVNQNRADADRAKGAVPL